MAFKLFFFCVTALLVQYISGNCVTRNRMPSGIGSSKSDFVSISSSGGDFKVTSIGPISPSGIYVTSDLTLDGGVEVCGTMPYMSAVKFDDSLPTSGSGSVDYSCGCNSDIGITSVSCGTGSRGHCSCRY